MCPVLSLKFPYRGKGPDYQDSPLLLLGSFMSEPKKNPVSEHLHVTVLWTPGN